MKNLINWLKNKIADYKRKKKIKKLQKNDPFIYKH